MKNLPTGKYAGCKHWPKVITAARLRPRFIHILTCYDKTGHPGCLNLIMDNADANLWLTYYTGKVHQAYGA